MVHSSIPDTSTFRWALLYRLQYRWIRTRTEERRNSEMRKCRDILGSRQYRRNVWLFSRMWSPGSREAHECLRRHHGRDCERSMEQCHRTHLQSSFQGIVFLFILHRIISLCSLSRRASSWQSHRRSGDHLRHNEWQEWDKKTRKNNIKDPDQYPLWWNRPHRECRRIGHLGEQNNWIRKSTMIIRSEI